MKRGVVEKIRAAGGEVYAITSEPQHLADQAHEHWDLDFENVGDPHQEISRTCSERGWLTLYANRGDLEFLQRGADWEVEHPKGYFQPGVLALTNAGRVLYRWRSVPSAENLGGTVARPTAEHAWSAIERSLAEGAAAGNAPHDDDPVVDPRPPPRAPGRVRCPRASRTPRGCERSRRASRSPFRAGCFFLRRGARHWFSRRRRWSV